MNKTALNTALVLAAIAVALKLIEFYLGTGSFAVFGYFLLLLAGIFQGLRIAHNRTNSLHFIFLFKESLKVAAVIAVIIGVFSYIHYKAIDPEFFERILADRVAEAKAQDYTEEQIARLKTNFRTLFNPAFYSTLIFFGLMAISLLYALVTTFLYKKIKVFRTY